MKLTPEQLAQFDRDGYLFFPGLFTPEETRVAHRRGARALRRREAYNVREKGKDAVRTNFAAHMYSEPFARLARHPRMIEPVQDLLGEELYMHQFKINGKMAFEGDVWQWHQDYGTWQNDDLMPDRARDERGDLPGRRERVQRPADVHPGQPQEGRDRREARPDHHQLPAVDGGQRPDPPAGGARRRQERRHRHAQGPGRLDDPVPLLPGACLDQQPVALEPRQRLPEPVRGQQPHPPLQAAGVHRAPRLHADRVPARRLPAEATTRSTCRGRTACRRARWRPRPNRSPTPRKAA